MWNLPSGVTEKIDPALSKEPPVTPYTLPSFASVKPTEGQVGEWLRSKLCDVVVPLRCELEHRSGTVVATAILSHAKEIAFGIAQVT